MQENFLSKKDCDPAFIVLTLRLAHICGSWVPRMRMKTLRIPGLACCARNETGRYRATCELLANMPRER